MTKGRTPLTVEDALTRVAGRLGWAAAAAVAGVGERQLRNYSDPDHGAALSFTQAVALDVAHRRDGADEAPFLAVYQQLLECGLTAPTPCDTLLADTAHAARETGEALHAAILAARPGATPADRALAAREVQEAVDGLTRVQRELGAPERPPDPVRRGPVGVIHMGRDPPGPGD